MNNKKITINDFFDKMQGTYTVYMNDKLTDIDELLDSEYELDFFKFEDDCLWLDSHEYEQKYNRNNDFNLD